MTGRRGRSQLINVEESNNARRLVNFSYTESFNRVTELTTENYRGWKRNMINLLSINDLLTYITKEKVRKLRKRDIKENIEKYTEDQFDDSLVYDLNVKENDINNDIIAQWIIMNSLSEITQKLIEGKANTAYKIWNFLKSSFTKNQQTRKMELKKKLDELKYDEEKDINIFMSELQNIIDDLEKIDGDMNCSTKVGILNRTLPENLRYINVFQYINNWEECTSYVKRVVPEIIISNNIETNNIKIDNAKKIFSIENENTNYKNKKPKMKKNAQRTTTRRNGRCNYCHKKGHYFYECKKRLSDRKLKFRKRKNIKNNNQRRQFHEKRNYANFMQKDNYNSVYSDSFTKDYNDNETISINYIHKGKYQTPVNNKELICWILDSGASINITNRKDKLINIKTCNEKIYLANNEILTTKYIGTFKGYINDQEIIINDVYYSPLIDKNLLSVGKLNQQNYKIIFNSHHNKPCATIYDNHQNKIINILSHSNNTFKLFLSIHPLQLKDIEKINTNNEINYTNMKTQDKLNLWHRRLAHFDIKMIKHKLLNTNVPLKCPLCIQSKIKNKPYPKSEHKSQHIFELIHMDLVGPLPDSIYCNKYFFTILDDFSRYGWVLFLKVKAIHILHFTIGSVILKINTTLGLSICVQTTELNLSI